MALEATQAELLARLGNVENKFPKRGRPPKAGLVDNQYRGSDPGSNPLESENISASELKLDLVDRIMEAAAKGNTP